MAASFSPSDNSAFEGDRTNSPSERQAEGLSAQTWDEMRTYRQESAMKAPSGGGDYLDFGDDIYGGQGTIDAHPGFSPESQGKQNQPADTCAKSDTKPMDTIKDVKDYAEKNFDKLDGNSDGFLSKEEIDEALKNKCLNDEERAALEILKKNQQGISELSNDEIGFENDGITKADLKEFDKKYDAYDKANAMSYYGVNDFKEMDKDGNGLLSKDELDQAIAATAKDSPKRAALQQMRDEFDELKGKENDEWGPESGLSWKDITWNAIEKGGGGDGFFDDPTTLTKMHNDLSEHQLKNHRVVLPKR